MSMLRIQLRGRAALPPAVLTLLLALGTPGTAAAQQACDPLPTDASDPLRYQRLGDRCEGTVVRLMSSTVLFPVSLTANDASLASPPNGPVVLSWPRARGSGVRLRVVTLHRGVNYRLDLARPAADTAYRWDTSRARRAGATAVPVGALAWTTLSIFRQPMPVLLPLTVGAGARRRDYLLTLVPQEDLRTLRISVARLDAGGTREVPLVTDELLRLGPYPANSPIRVPVPGVTEPGLYHVIVSGERRRAGAAGPAVADVWMLHAPPPAR
ncbi:MAG TPA: hypothetical protein VFQ45_15145 [Longimicrobium sp.]|nr:hypothetical protein [Longimicrobium sp.]